MNIRTALPALPALLVLVLGAAPSLLRAESASEIAARFDAQKAEALRAYLDANPEAADRDTALAILAGTSMALERFDEIPALLLERYELQPKGPDADLQVIVGEMVQPMIETSILSDQRDLAKSFIERVKSDFSDIPQAEGLERFLDQVGAELHLPAVGDVMEFSFTDLDGNDVDLAEMRDRVILIDFWATWCGPCIAEMPHLIAAYEEYGDKGFEIIGVSLDDNRAALDNFIAEREITWPQHFDGEGWGNEIAQHFGISQIPATFLIGKEGRIVATDLRGEALEEAIKKELGL